MSKHSQMLAQVDAIAPDCHMEQLCNLTPLPAQGFTVACCPFKVKPGSAGWIRAVAPVDQRGSKIMASVQKNEMLKQIGAARICARRRDGMAKGCRRHEINSSPRSG